MTMQENTTLSYRELCDYHSTKDDTNETLTRCIDHIYAMDSVGDGNLSLHAINEPKKCLVDDIGKFGPHVIADWVICLVSHSKRPKILTQEQVSLIYRLFSKSLYRICGAIEFFQTIRREQQTTGVDGEDTVSTQVVIEKFLVPFLRSYAMLVTEGRTRGNMTD